MGSIYTYNRTVSEFDWENINIEIENFCQENEIPTSKVFSLQLIIEELVTNIIKYGKSTGDEEIWINISIGEDQTINLTISDNTAPFNPLEIKAPDTALSVEERNIGGLGLVLVKQKAKFLSYEYLNSFNNIKIEI